MKLALPFNWYFQFWNKSQIRLTRQLKHLTFWQRINFFSILQKNRKLFYQQKIYFLNFIFHFFIKKKELSITPRTHKMSQENIYCPKKYFLNKKIINFCPFQTSLDVSFVLTSKTCYYIQMVKSFNVIQSALVYLLPTYVLTGALS